MRYNRNFMIKRSKRRLTLTLILLFFLPVFVIGFLQNKNFDSRKEAFEDIKVSKTYPCVITFPNVNPYTLEVNRTVRVQIDALSKDIGIKKLSVSDTLGNQLLEKTYDNHPKKITESLSYTPQVVRAYNLSGTIIDSADRAFQCVISSPYKGEKLQIITQNSKPSFTSSPSRDSKPSQAITAGTTYEYTIKAEDKDGDTINYIYSFTPDNNWLKATVIEDGGNGRLSISLKGSTQKTGSYLANIFIHDGYSTHLASQSWVINVSPKGAEIPIVKIIEPVQPVAIKEDDNIIVSWETVSSNKISKYELYYSSNPTNENSWQAIDTNISATTTAYNVSLTRIPDGAYRMIVRAIDTQTPPAIGMDISEEIIISRKQADSDLPDDKPTLPQPQIINTSPTSTDVIVNRTPTIRASLISSEGTTVDESSIFMSLNEKDITNEIKINKISETEFTVIYIPEESLTVGTHKVSLLFKDSQGSEQEKEWTFTISDDEEGTDGDYFYIFGLEMPKKIVYIIIGGLALIAFAILLPIIISLIWRDKTADIVDKNYALPQSLPSTKDEITPETVQQPIDQPVNEVFEAPDPILDLPSETEVQPDREQQPTPPDPAEDLETLYNQIKDIEEEDKQENTTKSST